MRAAADWIYGIAAVLLIGSAALQAVPKGAWQKYVKLFCGGMLILAVTSPVFSLLGTAGRTALSYQRNAVSSLFAGIEGSVSKEREEWSKEVQKRQETALNEPLSVLAQSYGFTLCSYTLRWEEETQLAGITLSVRAAGGGDVGDKAAGTAEKDSGDGANTAAGTAEKDGRGTEGGGSIMPVKPVEPVGEGENSPEKAGQENGPEWGGESAEAGPDGSGPGIETEGEEAGEAGPEAAGRESEPTYYEPSELRKLHEALETVLELPSDQVVIYLQREAQNE